MLLLLSYCIYREREDVPNNETDKDRQFYKEILEVSEVVRYIHG